MRIFVIEHLFLTLKIGFMIVEFGFGSFFITDLQDNKKNQGRNL